MAFDGTLKFDTAIDKTGFQVGLGKLGSIAKSGLAVLGKGIAAGSAAIGAGVAFIGKQALDAYGSYEQLVGGVETLFKESADIVRDYAANAYKTAGMSANEYMETVTSFSASLLQGLGGDTQAAAEIANTAITDMADNANKMGTDIGMIQNAYQGFAKQNYTMLDNLKLGYGGTAAEMARLINDSGVLGDSMVVTAETVKDVPFDQMIEAIHVVQTEMGITGTTSKEAASTIQGSIAMAGAAWENFLTGLGDVHANMDELTSQLTDSLLTVAENVIPFAITCLQAMTTTLADGLPDMVDAALSILEEKAPALAEAGSALASALGEMVMKAVDKLPEVAKFAVSLVKQFVSGWRKNASRIAQVGAEVVDVLLDSFVTLAPDLIVIAIEQGTAFIQSLAEHLEGSAPQLGDAAAEGLAAIGDALAANLPILAKAGISIVKSIGGAILDHLPELTEAAEGAVSFLTEELVTPENVLLVTNAAKDILLFLADGIVESVDELFLAAEEVVRQLCDDLTDPENIREITEVGTELLSGLVTGLCQLAGKFVGFASQLWDEIYTTLTTLDWGAVGVAIVEGICSGLLGCDFVMEDYLSEFGDNWMTGMKDVFGIHSPSRLMRDLIGKNLALGIGVGFTEEIPKVGLEALEAVEQLSLPPIDVEVEDPELPKTPTSGVLRALHDRSGMEGIAAPSATSSIVNNQYNYSTVNHHAQAPETRTDVPEKMVVNVYVGEELIGDAVVEYVDAKQGVSVQLKKRGHA